MIAWIIRIGLLFLKNKGLLVEDVLSFFAFELNIVGIDLHFDDELNEGIIYIK